MVCPQPVPVFPGHDAIPSLCFFFVRLEINPSAFFLFLAFNISFSFLFVNTYFLFCSFIFLFLSFLSPFCPPQPSSPQHFPPQPSSPQPSSLQPSSPQHSPPQHSPSQHPPPQHSPPTNPPPHNQLLPGKSPSLNSDQTTPLCKTARRTCIWIQTIAQNRYAALFAEILQNNRLSFLCKNREEK